MTRTIDTRTPAERVYDELKSGAAWERIQQITDDPLNDGSAEPSAEQRTAEFAAGYRDGLVLAQALIADEQIEIAAWIDERIADGDLLAAVLKYIVEDGGE